GCAARPASGSTRRAHRFARTVASPPRRTAACRAALSGGYAARARPPRVRRLMSAPDRAEKCCSQVSRKPQPHELPARIGREEVTVRASNVIARRGARPATQDVLVAHELAVVFTDGPGGRPEARVG